MKPKTFFLGLAFSLLISAIAWYWYKATAAEDGALELLDRMAATDARLRQLQAALVEQEVLPPSYISLAGEVIREGETAVSPEDLTQVHGVGPLFAERLHNAGIHAVATLAELSTDQLAAILEAPIWRAEAILEEAKGK
jgi:polyhydroxyalkanoate synthase